MFTSHHSPCKSVNIEPLKYSSYHDDCREQTISTCTMVALGVLILYLFQMHSRNMSYGPSLIPTNRPEVNFTRSAGPISARIVSSSSGMVVDAKDVFSDYFNASNVKLVDIKGVNNEKHDLFKTATVTEKEEVQTRMQAMASSKHPAVCMVFSPHCRHCWSTFPKIDKAATENPDVDFVLINYMALPSTYWDKVFPMEITYFPTMVAKKSTEMKMVPNVEEAVAQVKETGEAVASGRATVAEPTDDAHNEEEDTSFMAKLF